MGQQRSVGQAAAGVDAGELSVITDSIAHSFICLFVRLFVHSFVRAFVHSFIHPFIHSFSHLIVHSIVIQNARLGKELLQLMLVCFHLQMQCPDCSHISGKLASFIRLLRSRLQSCLN